MQLQCPTNVTHEGGMAQQESLNVFALNEGNSVTCDDIVAGLKWGRCQAGIIDGHALAPSEEMKQPGSVSSRLLSATGCRETCSNNASIIVEISLALGRNCQQLRRALWSWQREEWKIGSKSAVIPMRQLVSNDIVGGRDAGDLQATLLPKRRAL